MKKCTRCHRDLSLDNFYPSKFTKDGLDFSCRDCERKRRHARREQNQEYNKNYYLTHRGSVLRQVKKYRTTDDARKKRNLYRKFRRHADKRYRILNQTRVKLYQAIKSNTGASTIKELVGCSLKVLKRELSKQFRPGMSWKNYGKWHIDHKKACKFFDISDPNQRRLCFFFRNLHPLWAEENLKKQWTLDNQ